ncbi:DUF1573 domain-containing protein [bacterium]|nr:DUF1573 domain-containing protein [bacterium]
MRKVFFILLMVGFVLCFGQKATSQPKTSQAKPITSKKAAQNVNPSSKAKIELEETSFDFGFAPQGNSKLVHVFVIRNSGEDTLTITKVRPTCGCTAAPLEKKILAPGEKTDLKIIFRTRGYKRKTTKAVKIQSNDPINSMVSVRFSANFDTTQWNDVSKGPRIKADPATIGLGKGDVFQFKTKTTLKNISDQTLELKVIDFTKDVVSNAKIKKSKVKGNKSTTLEIKIDKDYDINKPVQTSITIAGYDKSGSEVTRISIPLLGGGK